MNTTWAASAAAVFFIWSRSKAMRKAVAREE